MNRAPVQKPFDLERSLRAYRARYPDEAAVVERFTALLSDHTDCFERHHFSPGHVTGSAWLVDDSGDRVLLTHHRKLDAWLQLGGHSDGNPDTATVAVREAEEESGLAVELLSPEILDIDIHEIPARKADPVHFHFDVRFAVVSRSGSDYVVSDESHDLAWVCVDRLGDFTAEQSMLRMGRKWASRRQEMMDARCAGIGGD